MGWKLKGLAIAVIYAALAGCAGVAHELPAVSATDSTRAAHEIGAAPDLKHTVRTTQENERLARQALSRLQMAAAPLCDSSERDNCHYTLEFSPKGKMNAFVWKNQIVMFNGLAQYLESEDEFAAVIAHEMGHHLGHHYEKALLNRKIGALIAGALFVGVASATDAYAYNSSQAGRDLESVMQIGEAIGDISFSKAHEREADYMAAYLLARAGYDPDRAGGIWIKLAKASGRLKTGIFDTHPAGPERLAAWQMTVDEVRYSADLMPNLADAGEEPRLQLARVFEGAPVTPDNTEAVAAVTPLSDVRQAIGTGTFGQALAGTSKVSGDQSGVSSQGVVWHGRGASDSCGMEWTITVEQDGSALRGHMWWSGVKYDVYGSLDSDGRTASARAGKSRESRNQPAPRFFAIKLGIAASSAEGRFGIEGQETKCQADFLLTRS